MATSTRITLKIVQKAYESGTPYFHLTGRLFGQIYQQNFPTRDEAESFKSGLIRAATQGKSGPPVRLAQTIFPTDQDLHAAELACTRLKAALPNASITTAVDFYLASNTVVVTDMSAEAAVKKFCSEHVVTGGQKITAGIWGSVLRKFLREQKITMISDLTEEKVRDFILDEKLVLEPRSRRDRRDLLHNFFEFLIGVKHLSRNLTDGIKRPEASSEGEISVFSVTQCQRLLDAAAQEPGGRHRIRGALLPYFATCMLSGMRPTEVRRLKPDWSNVIFEKCAFVGFRAKTKRARLVEMHDQLPGLLQQCKAAGLAPGYFSRKTFERIQRRAGVRIPVEAENKTDEPTEASSWDNDILRHSYASHHYTLNNNKGFLIKNMGNSEDVLDESYLNLTVLKQDGAAYFQMKPASLTGLGEKVPRDQAPRRKSAPVSPAQVPAAPSVAMEAGPPPP